MINVQNFVEQEEISALNGNMTEAERLRTFEFRCVEDLLYLLYFYCILVGRSLCLFFRYACRKFQTSVCQLGLPFFSSYSVCILLCNQAMLR
jgi:hypothetical protein